MRIPEIVRQYVDAFEARNAAGCADCFAPEGTYSDQGTPHPLPPDEIKQSFGDFFAGFPDATTETRGLDPISDDTTVWRWTIRATQSGPYQGKPPTGRVIVLPGCEFITVRQGRIYRVDGYFDRLTVLLQLGLFPTPASTPASQ